MRSTPSSRWAKSWHTPAPLVRAVRDRRAARASRPFVAEGDVNQPWPRARTKPAARPAALGLCVADQHAESRRGVRHVRGRREQIVVVVEQRRRGRVELGERSRSRPERQRIVHQHDRLGLDPQAAVLGQHVEAVHPVPEVSRDARSRAAAGQRAQAERQAALPLVLHAGAAGPRCSSRRPARRTGTR